MNKYANSHWANPTKQIDVTEKMWCVHKPLHKNRFNSEIYSWFALALKELHELRNRICDSVLRYNHKQNEQKKKPIKNIDLNE